MSLRRLGAEDLAAIVVVGLPRRSLWRRLNGFRVPDRVNDGTDELCPKCGRRLVCSLGPIGEGIVALPRSRREVLGACLVDGARREHAGDLAPDAIVRAAHTIADGLDAAKWKPWSNTIRRALAGASESWPPVEAAGQALEALRAFGPMASELEPPDPVRAAQDALEVLVTSSGPSWLDCRSIRVSRT